MPDELTDLFATESGDAGGSLIDTGGSMMFDLLNNEQVSQVVVNRYDRVFVSDSRGITAVQAFATSDAYYAWLNELLKLTDVGYDDVRTARTAVIEGSFNPEKTAIHGSIHVATREITRGDPVLTVRKQPVEIITLDDMLMQGMLSEDMRMFLTSAVRGRANMLISGGSGAGKTTLARALCWYIEPNQRVLTAEEIDELHLYDTLSNVVALTTYKDVDTSGMVVRRVELDELVKEALRMRADRIWVGETRGREAYALVKACNSGHDGSVTTVHADNGQQAVKQLVSYVMEADVPEEVARDQVAQAFHLVVQIQKVKMGKRVITEITELESVREGGNEQRRNALFRYDLETETFRNVGRPSAALRHHLAKYGVTMDNPGSGTPPLAPVRRV